ncbi:MAG: recombinase RecA, partial [Comamonas sp.]
DNSREFLRENPALAFEIENKVRDSLGIALLPGAVGEETAKPAKGKKGDKNANVDEDGVIG